MLKSLGLATLAFLLCTVPAAAQANVAGNWVITFESPQGPVAINAVLEQDGSNVTGTAEVPMIESAEMSAGSIDGSALTFAVSVVYEAQVYRLDFAAEVEGDAMTGTVSLPEMGTIPFRGERTQG
jgi:hypothetical protein